MISFRQIFAMVEMNLSTLPQRLGGCSVLIIGNAGVVAVLISVLAMAVGFTRTVNQTGRPDRVIVLRGGSNSELTSVLSRDAALTIDDAPGVKHDAKGDSIASSESVMVVPVNLPGNNKRISMTVRGVSRNAAMLRPEIHITEGRMFTPGMRELIAGRTIQKQFPGLKVGNRVTIGNGEWQIVGAFDSGGDSHESEVLGDVESVLDALRRKSFTSVTVMLESPGALGAFKSALMSDPTLSVEVVRESDYYAQLSGNLSHLLIVVGLLVGVIMSIGAIFGALNTMYTTVSSRRVEVATLRAMGFDSTNVIISFAVEGIILALFGGLLGALLACLVFNGNAVNTLAGDHTPVVFKLIVTPALVALGLAIAVVIGLVGGLIPAIRSARLPVVAALRQL
ncbi:ABC transporter permease [Dyella flagellata]|uniref:Membrane protein n=1 Tax=Dyella flagellata TaxID=1867833 RepID=A0ABQ5XA28_9GAMM|nr:ABC transporter permease [Dyella flagellata]GLQ87923.1 membrane protein [Dyella flagellata]